MLEEKLSKNLNVPYVYLPNAKKFLCSNGVLFTLEEYKNGIDIQKEYERRAKENQLYDYPYARSTGLLRKKRTVQKTSKSKEVKVAEVLQKEKQKVQLDKSVSLIVLLLTITSVISMYISTLHTATYLIDYVDIVSAWLMSASVTAYNSTAFEVSVLFHSKKRNLIAFIFMFLWLLVTLFSMITTVSVFYDQFNFTETQIQEENKTLDSNKLALEVLQKKEQDLREAIEFKKKDIEYRQAKDYATATIRVELNSLQNALQQNLTEQQKVLKDTPEITSAKATRKESLFSFLGRIWHIENSILEFIMSSLSAVFINLIAPLSLSAVTELLSKSSVTVNNKKVDKILNV